MSLVEFTAEQLERDRAEFAECDNDTLIAQIGRGTLMAVSGLRVQRRPTGVTLPVDCGYSVTVDLDGVDEYVVRRMFARGTKRWIKGELRGVQCDEVGEAVYRASCFRNGEWP